MFQAQPAKLFWLVPFGYGALLFLAGISWLVTGEPFDKATYERIGGLPWEKLVSGDCCGAAPVVAALVRLIGGNTGLLAGGLVVALSASAFRRGEQWAWYCSWLLPLHAAADLTIVSMHRGLGAEVVAWDLSLILLLSATLAASYGSFFAKHRKPAEAGSMRRILLICGVLSPLLYAMADLLAGMRWEGYSFRDQVISELGAIGAPSKPFFSILLAVVYLLLIAFGVGVWQSVGSKRRLRAVAGLLVGLGVLALTVGQFVPMRPRGTEQGLTGALHLIEGAVAMLMVMVAMGVASTVFGRRFRLYTIVTIALVLAFGAWSGMDAPRIEAGVATPWAGVKERIFWYAYQLWFAVLALTLLREGTEERGKR